MPVTASNAVAATSIGHRANFFRARYSVNEMERLHASRAIWAPRLLSVLRAVTGFLFLAHGTQKLLGFPAPRATPVEVWSLGGIAGVMELVGGALVLLGLFTRPVAFLLSGLMAAAYFIAHAPQGFWPLINRGELAALYSFVFLYLAAAGGGPWSLDALRRRR
jgi:putative oxidoreductase